MRRYLLVGCFKNPGYSFVFRLDRNQIGRGILGFTREDIPSNLMAKYN